MSENVQFDTDEQVMPRKRMDPAGFATPAGFGQSQVPGMASWLVKKGIIKSEGTAKSLLVAIVFANFIIAAIIFYFFVFR